MTTETSTTISRTVIDGTGPYNFDFRIFDESELTVVVDTGDIDPVTLTLNTHYTVAGINDEEGGTVTLINSAETTYDGETLDIRSNTAQYQPTSIRNQGRFLPEIHEDAFDRLSRQVQDIDRRLNSKFGYPDNGTQVAAMVNRASWAGRYVYVGSGGAIEPAAAIGTQALSQSLIGELLFPQTQAESDASEMPSAYDVPSNDAVDIVHAARFGFAAGNSAAANVQALEAAIAVAVETNALGGCIVQLPAGAFQCDPFVIPQRVRVRGMGAFSTRLTNSAAAYFATLGASTANGVIKENAGIEDLFLENLHKDGHGLLLMECRAASVRRVYHEGTTISGRSNIFMTIDGGNISAYFNHIEDCVSNHVQTLVIVTASGSGNATSQFFKNVCGTGDKASFASSVGVRITNGHGSGTVWVHGNLEQFGTGWQQESGSQGCTILGGRFEGNTADIRYQATAGGLSVLGSLITPSTIVNTANDQYDHLSLIGCVDGDHNAVNVRMPRGVHLLGSEPGNGVDSECPLVVEAYPGWTTDILLKLINSAGTSLFAVNSTGQVTAQAYRSGGSSPVGSVTPRFIGEEYLNTTGAGTWYKATGVANTSWVALN